MKAAEFTLGLSWRRQQPLQLGSSLRPATSGNMTVSHMADEEFQRHVRLLKTSVRWLRDEFGEHTRLRRLPNGLRSLTVEE